MKVIILDDSFTGWYGHNAPYNFAICDELDNREIGYLIFGNHRIINVIAEMRRNIIPAFRFYAGLSAVSYNSLRIQVLNTGVGMIVANYNHFIDLQANVLPHVEDGDIILVAMSSSATAFAHGLFFSKLEKLGKTITAVIVQHNRPYGRLFSIECSFLKMVAKNINIIFATQNGFLSDLCQSYTGYKYFTFPLPYVKELTYQACSENKRINFAYLGVAEDGKGFDLLPKTIIALKDLLISGLIEFTIQCNARKENIKMQNIVTILKKISEELPCIKIIEGGLSPNDYLSELLNTDVVLNPHRASSYQYARSGVFSEAIAAGIPVIVASGTLMAKELRELQAGLVFDDCSSDSLAQTIRSALKQIDTLRVSSRLAQKLWIKTHNPKAYVDTLLNIYHGL